MTGTNLRWLRKRVRVSLEDLANILGEDMRDISLWERGELDPGKNSFVRLCNFFELDKSAILLLDLSRSDLFTTRKQLSVKKKVIGQRRKQVVVQTKSKTGSYH
jgi:transcriptional regulator with XRE-family HTH domain